MILTDREIKIAIERGFIGIDPPPHASFRTNGHEIDFQIDLDQETVWATQQQIADLFGVGVPAISKHISNIYAEGELAREATLSKLETVRSEAGRQVSRTLDHYNLDIILAVGYRVSGKRATEFRQWATKTLRAYLTEGYVLNERRLRDDPQALQQLAERVRALRTEEKNLYARVRGCFAMSAVDYDKDAPEVRRFFTMLQEKFTFAACENTTAEVILQRADGGEPNMGLMTFAGDAPTLQDAKIGKNYLSTKELRTMQILADQFLLFVESKAVRGKTVTMADLLHKLDRLLDVNEYPIFDGYQTNYLRDRADEHARRQLEVYRSRIASDRSARDRSPRNLPKPGARHRAHQGVLISGAKCPNSDSTGGFLASTPLGHLGRLSAFARAARLT